jgi:hypothetical protein
MSDSSAEITITLRIPGLWERPEELVEALPPGFRMAAEGLILPGGELIECWPVAADDRFAEVFRSSCRRPPTEDEMRTVNDYAVNVVMKGPGGSLDAACTMMEAAAAIVRAGGAGVFIDNSALAHGGQLWLEMADDGGPDALTFAYVSIVGGRNEVYTMGMHVLGLRDVLMKRADLEDEQMDIVDVIRYLAASDKPIDDGHVLADLEGPRYQAFFDPSVGAGPPGSPLHNPFGRLKLVSMKDVAEKN